MRSAEWPGCADPVKIYTRAGDTGETGLFGSGRVPKDHPRIIACGAIDELNAFLGRAVPLLGSELWRGRLGDTQHDLFTLGSYLASPEISGEKAAARLPGLPERRVKEMEAWIDEMEVDLLPLRAFILPGGCASAQELHVCRTVCRRAERSVVALRPADPRVTFAIQYLNRLSDFLFVLARFENRRAGVEDVEWRKDPP